MRTNIFRWFSELGINDHYNLMNSNDLFEREDLLKKRFLTSLLRDPVYINGKNYSGRSPHPWDNPLLSEMMEETFEVLNSAKHNCLIVPCGQIVSTALMGA